MLSAWYINLDSATARRDMIEANFAQCAPDVPLTRVPAVNAAEVKAKGVPGTLRDGEKAAFLSHRKAVEMSLASPDAALIVEDDAQLGPRSIELLREVTEKAAPHLDLLYPEAAMVSAVDLIRFYGLSRRMALEGRLDVFDLAGLAFAGAVAYVVMPAAKARLLERLDAAADLDQALDLYMRDDIHAGRLKAGVTLPYLVGQSPLSDQSQLREGDEPLKDLAWTAFRRMMNLDFDPDRDDPTAALRALPPGTYDKQAGYFADILRLYLSDSFGLDWSAFVV